MTNTEIREKLVELLEDINAIDDEECGIDRYTGCKYKSRPHV